MVLTTPLIRADACKTRFCAQNGTMNSALWTIDLMRVIVALRINAIRPTINTSTCHWVTSGLIYTVYLSTMDTIHVFSKLPKLAMMGILSSETFWEHDILVTKCYSQWILNPGPLINLWFQVQHSPLWTNLTSWHSHCLLIPTNSLKSKNQVVHGQKFKDLLSSTYLTSSEGRALDLDSEVNYPF